MPQQTNRGFSIVELLVVISIIAVMTALILPSLKAARTAAGIVKCASGARGVNNAVLIYATDYKNNIPSSFAGVVFPRLDGGVQPTATHTYHNLLVLTNYAQQIQFTNRAGCPDGPRSYSSANGSGYYPLTPGLPAVVSYGFNARLQSGYGLWSAAYRYNGPMPLHKFRAGRNPSLVSSIYDSAAAGTTPYESQSFQGAIYVLAGIPTGGSPNPDPAQRRHAEKGVNFIFLDGSGRFIDSALLLQFKSTGTGPDHVMATFATMFSSYNNYFIDGRPN